LFPDDLLVDLLADLLADLALMDDGASGARSIRTTGRMMITAEAPGMRAGLPRNRIPRGNLMTAPIVPPGRLTEWSDLQHATDVDVTGYA
jgi:hypothetical protein